MNSWEPNTCWSVHESMPKCTMYMYTHACKHMYMYSIQCISVQALGYIVFVWQVHAYWSVPACSFVTSCKDHPVQLWDAFIAERRTAYVPYNDVVSMLYTMQFGVSFSKVSFNCYWEMNFKTLCLPYTSGNTGCMPNDDSYSNNCVLWKWLCCTCMSILGRIIGTNLVFID